MSAMQVGFLDIGVLYYLVLMAVVSKLALHSQSWVVVVWKPLIQISIIKNIVYIVDLVFKSLSVTISAPTLSLGVSQSLHANFG
jgi:hypothetical protein